MFKRPNTNCNCLFLNKNKVTIDNKAEAKNNKGVTFSKREAPENKSIIYTGKLLELVQRLNTNVKTAEIIPATNK